MTWTPERLETLSRLCREGHSARAIGTRLGITRSAVIGAAYRHHIRLANTVEPAKRTAAATAPGPDRLAVQVCQWPIGDVGAADFRFCGAAPVETGKPYCAAHCKRAYRKRGEIEA